MAKFLNYLLSLDIPTSRYKVSECKDDCKHRYTVFYIHHKEDEKGTSGGQLSRGFDLNYGRDEMTSGGQREHRGDVLEENLRNMGLEPADFTFYTDGFRYGAPPHAGWGLGVARLLMVLTGAGNVREVVLFPRDRSRVTP